MSKTLTLYCGLNKMLLFDSLEQHFQCPISTTVNPSIANGFGSGGIMLQLKRANSKTRYFDVSWLSVHKSEKERLIMGSSLKIHDIYIRVKSTKKYVNAIRLLEQLTTGKFIDTTDESEKELYFLIKTYLEQNDTDDYQLKYIKALFENMLNRILINVIWMNENELTKIKHTKLRQWINKISNITSTTINFVLQLDWRIDGDTYRKFKTNQPRQYIRSRHYQYDINDKEQIAFHLECCSKYSHELTKCALFLYLDQFPVNIESIQIAYDLLCNKKPIYRNYMPPQRLSKSKTFCGFQVFSCTNLEKNDFIEWHIGLKVIEIKYIDTSKFDNNANQDENVLPIQCIELKNSRIDDMKYSKDELDDIPFIETFRQTVLDVFPNMRNINMNECERIASEHKLNGDIFIKGTSKFINKIQFAKLFKSVNNTTKKAMGYNVTDADCLLLLLVM
eukprot:389952_1